MCTKLLHNCKQKQVCQYSPVATCTVYCSYMYTVLTVGTVCCVHTHSSHHTLGMHPVHKVARDATGENQDSGGSSCWQWVLNSNVSACSDELDIQQQEQVSSISDRVHTGYCCLIIELEPEHSRKYKAQINTFSFTHTIPNDSHNT